MDCAARLNCAQFRHFLRALIPILDLPIPIATPPIQAFFIGLNGHQKLINLAANCQEEPLLWRVTKLLDKVAQLVSEPTDLWSLNVDL